MMPLKSASRLFQKVTCYFFLLLIGTQVTAQTVPVGNGSYTTVFPGVDIAGRNSFPSGTPFTTGVAATKPTPTNDWWSHKVKNPHSSNLFNYPFTLKTINTGLVVSYIPWGPIDNIEPVVVGISGLNASQANVSDFSDWTVSLEWPHGGNKFSAHSAIGMNFVYFEKDSTDVARVQVNQGAVTIDNEILLIVNARNGADFAVYAPTGSTWQQNGNTYTSTLNGENYWSLAFLPLQSGNPTAAAQSFKKYAYVFPVTTAVNWSYNANTSIVATNFEATVAIKEGTDSTLLMGLLPHQWANLAPGAPSFSPHTFPTVRGSLKMMETNSFTVENTFYGILPTLPYLDNYSPSFSPSQLNNKVKQLENDQLNPWTDSYNEGQEMNRLIQTARIAELTGDTVAFQKLKTTVKNRLENWLTASAGEVAFIFFYNQTWQAMLGYPAGHGQDNNINDHHFHWGYFIHAAAFLEQFEPGWANQWGGMVDLLVRDAASPDQQDSLFPFLRNFSPYAGHCWANGFASFPQGNDQESTSESMQFNSSLIHWGAVTGNDAIRDLGIYLYTTEQSAVEEYWFDQYNRNFGPTQQYSLVSRVWGNSYDNGTFWTSDIAASYGIELYPIHGGSLYLGHDTNYVNQLWAEIEQNTGILTNDPNVNLWHDIMWQYLAFVDPDKAIALYDSYANRNLKFGVSDALTYHWLHAMNVLGNVSTAITSNHPLAAVFIKNGDTTYVAQNYTNTQVSVAFSNGFTMDLPPNKLVTSKDISVTGLLSASFLQAYPGGSVDLEVTTSGGVPSQVVLYKDDSLVATFTQAPYEFTATNLGVGRHTFYARIYEGNRFNISNMVTITVGEQLPFGGQHHSIPGAFDAAHYDIFEGGNGNGIAYQDLTTINQGNFRVNESVDAKEDNNEGDYVGWISPGEWLEYSVEVQQAGFYNLSFRYASGNTTGGGPIRIESDGQLISGGILAPGSGGWNNWATHAVSAIPMKSGKQILRIYFEGGEINLGKLTFSFDAPLNFAQPIANAGPNQIVQLPQTITQLVGAGSSTGGSGSLQYSWKQIYGPTILSFSNDTLPNPVIQTLAEGVYLLELTVQNGAHSDVDEVYIISSTTNNVAPKVSIIYPSNNQTFIEQELIDITAIASDLNDSVVQVDFSINNNLQSTSFQPPHTSLWQPTPGNYTLVATAKDGLSDSTQSSVITVTVTPAPPCDGVSWDGDFGYRFSPAENNPTLTFIPSLAGMGSPTCILYYGTDPGNMPGYIVSPNVPFTINATKGTRIYFYYTYSYPGAGEKNNAANKDSYVVGTCKNIGTDNFISQGVYLVYPNPVRDLLFLNIPKEPSHIQVFSALGHVVYSNQTQGGQQQIDMAAYSSGLYLVTITNAEGTTHFKVVKSNE